MLNPKPFVLEIISLSGSKTITKIHDGGQRLVCWKISLFLHLLKEQASNNE